jgi:phosphatidylglycerol---prolipoprotein diacylglyceryl transferase
VLVHPQPDPIAIALGPLQVHWYGLMYLLAFLTAWWLGRQRAKQAWRNWTPEQVDDLIFYGAIGVILGGRIGYTLFYNFGAFLDNPLWIFALWTGGMSFHGGFLGVLIAVVLFCRKHRKAYWDVVDFTAPVVPTGLLFGRIGNFINGELPGRAAEASLPWAMQWPGVEYLVHPSPLYQALTEGVLLFLIVWFFSWRPRPRYAVSGLFALGYGTFRFITEFFREPDAHIGYLYGDWLTMGQLLSLPLVAVGVFMLVLAYRKRIMPVIAEATGQKKDAP